LNVPADFVGTVPRLNDGGRIHGFLWETQFLVYSDFLVAAPHSHSALQLSVGLEAAPRVQLGGAWRDARGALIDTDVVHAFDCAGAMTAIGWVEGESRAGQELREQVLGGEPFAILDDAVCAQLVQALGPGHEQSGTCAEAHERWNSALAVLSVDVGGEPEVDDRIAAVLAYLRATPSPPPSIKDLVAIAHLSESRLQHVFREQVGVPIRRYLLWHRYLTAMSLLADGVSATAAAHAAGFSDSAHFTRTAVRMNGFTPTKMPFRNWLSNCR
jgi:AraC-like DNA-binding protein